MTTRRVKIHPRRLIRTGDVFPESTLTDRIKAAMNHRLQSGSAVKEKARNRVAGAAEQVHRLDKWIEDDGGRFSRPEAIRVLLEHAWGRTVASRGVPVLSSRLNEPKPQK